MSARDERARTEEVKIERQNKLQLRIDLILTAIFFAVIFFMGAMTLITDMHGIYVAATDQKKLFPYIEDPEDYSAWDYFAARIRSVDDYLAENVYASDALGHMNSSFQYAMGKRMINTGASQMITLNSGHLFDLQNYVSMENAVENLVGMRATAGDLPFLFVYEHPTIYSADQMPAGYDVLDYSEEIAAELTERMADTDIPMIDSRDVLTATGLPLSDYLMYTDQHWATRASLIMAQRIAGELSEMTGVDLHPEKLDISQFNTETFPKLFMGKYGQRIGTGNIDPDDITIYWPKYDTDIYRYTNYLGDITEVEGSFYDSVIRWKYLEPDPGKTWNIRAYFDYGLTENHDIYHNAGGAPCTILLLKDSYSASIGSFLSLVADEVVAVDLRRSDLSLREWIDRCDPDAVVVAYSMQMLRDDAYEFQ